MGFLAKITADKSKTDIATTGQIAQSAELDSSRDGPFKAIIALIERRAKSQVGAHSVEYLALKPARASLEKAYAADPVKQTAVLRAFDAAVEVAKASPEGEISMTSAFEIVDQQPQRANDGRQ